MSRPLLLKINTTRIDQSKLFVGRTGAKYLDVVVWENKNGPDQYGNTHTVVQAVSKEERAQGIKGNICGNGKYGGGPSPAPVAKPAPKTDDGGDSNVPF